MPIVSRFYGIVVFIFWRDHSPPHFHARYGEHEIIVEIETGAITGTMPGRATSMVQQWRELHKDELMENWRLAEQKKPLRHIEPLE